jgi:hypothetical protein
MGLSINLATGQNAQGVIQTGGDLADANWTVTNADSYKNSPIAYTVAPGNGDWYGQWLGNGPDSTWIAANPDTSANGDMVFTLHFSLTADEVANAQIVGGLATLDDIGVVLLNGHQIGSVAYNTFNQLHSLSSGAGDFVAGTNTLTIQITQSDNLYEGVRLEGKVVDVPSSGLKINLATGQNAQGVIQTTGDLPDANWTVTNADNYKNAPIAYTVAPGNADWGGGAWFDDGPNSCWIAADPDTAVNGSMTFTFKFNLAGYDPAHARILGGLIALDDRGTVSLNGHLLATVPNGYWGEFTQFGDGTGDFVTGLNTLTIQITQSDHYLEAVRLEGTVVDDVSLAPIHWANAVSGDFTTASDWSGGAVPTSTDNVILDAAGANYTVSSSADETVNSIQLAANATLSITGGTFTSTNGTGTGANQGLIAVSGGGIFAVGAGSTVDNAGGTIAAGDGSIADMSGATLAGGTLQTTGSGVIYAGILDGTASAVANQGLVAIRDGSQMTIKGSLQNSGTLSLQGQSSATSLIIGQGGSTLSGGGSVILSDNANNTIATSSSGTVLTNVDNTISGAGTIGGGGMGFTNQAGGIVDADGTNSLTLSTTGAVSNAGLFEATGGAQFFIVSTTIDNAGGTISAGDGSRVYLHTADIEGGTLASGATGQIRVLGSGNILDGTATAVDITGRLAVRAGATLTGQGTIDNSGWTVIRGTGTLTGPLVNTDRIVVVGGTLTVQGAVTGSGTAVIAGGTMTFGSSFDEKVYFNGSGTLVLADSQHYGHTVWGFSQTGATALDLRDIGFVGANEATFLGDANGGVLTVTDGTHTANITLKGDYRSSTFTAADDGHGGVIVTDPKVSQLIQAVAALSAPAAGLLLTHDPARSDHPAMLAASH